MEKVKKLDILTLTKEQANNLTGMYLVQFCKKSCEKLLRWNTRNRNMHSTSLSHIETEMVEGRWDPLNGQTYSLTSDPVFLNDGQKRLQAQLNTGLYYDGYLLFGVKPKSQLTIDMNQKRSFSDWLELNGYSNTKMLAAIVYRTMSFFNGEYIDPEYKKKYLSFVEMEDFFKKNIGEIQFYYKEASNIYYQDALNLLSISEMAAFFFFWGDDYFDKAKRFFKKVATGLDIKSDKEPAYKLRSFLAKKKRTVDAKLTRKARLILMNRAFFCEINSNTKFDLKVKKSDLIYKFW